MNYFKVLGIITVAVAIVFSGFSISALFGERRKNLEIIILLLERIREEIRFGCASTDDVLSKLSVTEPFSKLGFIKNTKFRNISRMNISIYNYVNQTDEDYIKNFFGTMGNFDKEGEINLCNKYIDLLSQNYNDAKKNEYEKTKLIKTLSILASLTVVIIII